MRKQFPLKLLTSGRRFWNEDIPASAPILHVCLIMISWQVKDKIRVRKNVSRCPKWRGVFFVKPEYASVLCQIALWGSGDCSRTLSLLLLAITKLHRKLGTVITKQSHNAIRHNTFPVPIGHWHDYVILLLRPQSFRVLLSCANKGFCHLMLPGITK